MVVGLLDGEGETDEPGFGMGELYPAPPIVPFGGTGGDGLPNPPFALHAAARRARTASAAPAPRLKIAACIEVGFGFKIEAPSDAAHRILEEGIVIALLFDG